MSGSVIAPQDRRLAIIAGAGVAVSLAAVLVRAFGLMPTEAAGGIALVGVVVALRVALLFAAKASSSAARARVMTLVSTVGLAVSAVTLVAALPHITKLGGMGRFTADTAAHLWTLALLTVAAGAVRTLTWRVLLGSTFAGFLAVASLARLVGTPVVHHFGTGSLFATAIWAPVTEEIIKALPLVLVLALAVRRQAARPSALDLCLLGAWTGTGFALYEDALYARGGAAWSANPPFSLLVPSQLRSSVGDSTFVAAGHLVYTGLIGLGLAIAILYRRRYRYAWLAGPVAVAVVVAEHVGVNALPLVNSRGGEPLVEQILAPLTLGGRLSSILLIAGVAWVAVVEWRGVRRSAPSHWIALRPAEAGRRAGLMAAVQQGDPSAGRPAHRPAQHQRGPQGAQHQHESQYAQYPPPQYPAPQYQPPQYQPSQQPAPQYQPPQQPGPHGGPR